MGLTLAVASGFLAAAAAPWVCRALPLPVAGWVLAVFPGGILAYLLLQIPAVAAGEATLASAPWIPGLGITLALRLDGLALLYGLLVAGAGVLVFGYAGSYMAPYPRTGRFFTILLLFTASMLGVVLADDALLLFACWELTSVASFLLIGFHDERGAARAAAWQALLVTVLGGQALLVAVLLTGQAAGSYELSAWVAAPETVRGSGTFAVATALLLLACFTKSALFPFHFWLPSAMQAPTPVSAYLHSAAMVQAGVYLLARLWPVFGETTLWTVLVTGGGAATVLVGSFLAIVQAAFKPMLAYSTVAMLGATAMLLGIGGPGAIRAGLALVVAHALYKSAMFLAVGAVERGAGVSGVRDAPGLWRAMPSTAAATLVAAGAMAGLPPFVGYVAKEAAFGAAAEAGRMAAVAAGVLLVGMSVATAVALVFALRPLARGEGATAARKAQDPPAHLWLPVAVLAGASLGLGVASAAFGAALLAPAASAAARTPVGAELPLWHGLTRALALGAASWAVGLALYVVRDRWHDRVMAFEGVRVDAARLYDAAIEWLLAAARVQTRAFQSGFLRAYLLLALLTTVLVIGAATAVGWAWPRPTAGPFRSYEVGIAALVVGAAVAALVARSLITVVMALGVVGFGVAIVFVLFSAPDLAMAQFLVETVTVILFVLVFHRLPRMAGRPSHSAIARDAAIAVTAGALMMALVLAATAVEPAPGAAESFLRRSLPEAHGRNVINSILVDFRALDTLGEVVVLATAAFGVHALIRQAKRRVGGGSRRATEMPGKRSGARRGGDD